MRVIPHDNGNRSRLDQEPGGKYVDKLCRRKNLYWEKIIDINGINLYGIPSRLWSASPDPLSDASYISIQNYFFFGQCVDVHTCDDFKAYNSLQTHIFHVSG